MSGLITLLSHEVVRASAGSGKTYQLTTRYLALLGRGEVPGNILAATFTRKAAGEVLARVLGRLSQACRDVAAREALSSALGVPVTDRDCFRMLRGLVDEFGRLSVGTIDGFFNRAARAMALELGLPTDPRLIDEGSPLARQIRHDAIHAVLGEQAADDEGFATLIEMLRRLHHDTAKRSVAEAIDEIVSSLGEVYRSHRDPALWDALPETGLLSDALLVAAVQQLEVMHEQLPSNKDGKVYKSFADRYRELIEACYARRWDEVLVNGLVAKVDHGAEKYGHAPIDAAWHQAIRPMLVHAKANRIQDLASQTRATHQLLALFDQRYTALRNSRRVLLFSDLTHLLADGLPGMGEAGIDELCYRLDARLAHLLLDEFQDTSLLQWGVLAPIAEQVAATGDGSRSLYCVGDTKQAIYGWRGGCAELFDVVEALPGVERTTLSKSWRSSQVVLDAVNQVFSTLDQNAALNDARDAADAWQQGYETHEAVQADLPGHVVLHTTAASDHADSNHEDDGHAPPDGHAHHAAHYIRELVAQMPGRSIGVLMRSRAKARVLMHALRGRGVDAAEEGGNPIADTPAVSAVLSAIHLADHPGDTVARFHVTNSPVGEVLGLADTVKPDAYENVARTLRRTLIDRGYAALIADWARALAPSCDAKSLRRLEQLVALAERYDETEAGLRPSFFVEAVKAQKVADASPAAVRVMTIHASKGLEFDAVVLADLDGVLSGPDKNELVVVHRDSPVAPVGAVYRRLPKAEQALLPELEAAHNQHAYEKRTEDLCLLYVAMTRARQALHLLVRPLKQGKNNKPGVAGRTNLSYAAVLRQALSDTDAEGYEGNELLYESGDRNWTGSTPVQRERVEAIAQASICLPIPFVKAGDHATRGWATASPSAMRGGGGVSADDLLRRSPSDGRSYGTLMHALLECVGFIDEGEPTDDEWTQVAASVPDQASDPGYAIAQLRKSFTQPAVRQLLNRDGADELWRERPFVARIDQQLVKGVFDRVHLWRQGGQVTRALLIDYKTDRGDDANVQVKADEYADQLRLYRGALSTILGIEPAQVQAKLLFVGDARVVEIN